MAEGFGAAFLGGVLRLLGALRREELLAAGACTDTFGGVGRSAVGRRAGWLELAGFTPVRDEAERAVGGGRRRSEGFG